MARIDLSKTEGTITNEVESLISRMESMSEDDIREEFHEILLSQKTSVGIHTVNKWINSCAKARNKYGIMQIITNLYLAGSNLSINNK